MCSVSKMVNSTYLKENVIMKNISFIKNLNWLHNVLKWNVSTFNSIQSSIIRRL